MIFFGERFVNYRKRPAFPQFSIVNRKFYRSRTFFFCETDLSIIRRFSAGDLCVRQKQFRELPARAVLKLSNSSRIAAFDRQSKRRKFSLIESARKNHFSKFSKRSSPRRLSKSGSTRTKEKPTACAALAFSRYSKLSSLSFNSA